MVNEEKLKMMIAVARDEKEIGANKLEEGRYEKSDYLRSRVFSLLGSFTAAYLLLLVLFALFHIDYILVNFVSLDYRLLVITLVAVYIVMILFCSVVSLRWYSKKYQQEQVIWKRYHDDLHRLMEYYREGKETGDDDAAGN